MRPEKTRTQVCIGTTDLARSRTTRRSLPILVRSTDRLNLFALFLPLATVIGASGAPRQVEAQTTVIGDITDLTWTPEGSPYTIEADASVPIGQTLTIEAGTIIEPNDGVELSVAGAIDARGTADAPVIFRQADPAGDWDSIVIEDTATEATFAHTEFIGSDFGVIVEGSADVSITDALFTDMDDAAVWIREGNALLDRVRIDDVQDGIEVDSSGSITVQNCIIAETGDNAIEVALDPDSGDSNVRHCTIDGTTDIAISVEFAGSSNWLGDGDKHGNQRHRNWVF